MYSQIPSKLVNLRGVLGTIHHRLTPPPTCRAKNPKAGPSPAAINLVLEILCFCTHHHGFRIKHFILQNGMIEKVLRLLHRPERWLVIAAIRFMRACISLKDEFYYRHIVSLSKPHDDGFTSQGMQ